MCWRIAGHGGHDQRELRRWLTGETACGEGGRHTYARDAGTLFVPSGARLRLQWIGEWINHAQPVLNAAHLWQLTHNRLRDLL